MVLSVLEKSVFKKRGVNVVQETLNNAQVIVSPQASRFQICAVLVKLCKGRAYIGYLPHALGQKQQMVELEIRW